MSIGSLPEDLVFEILLHLPAQDVYKSAILVCKKWYNAVHSRNFVYKHVQHSTPGLLVQDLYFPASHPAFVAMGRGPIEISKFNYEFKGRVWGSCNGLILESIEWEDSCDLYISNPVTKQSFALPPIPRQVDFQCYPMITYVEACKKYKVVVMWFRMFQASNVKSCAILTVEVDKSWRPLDIKHLNIGAPLTTQGFIHWTHSEGTYISNMNVETEIITETLVPQSYAKRLKYCFSTGSCVTLLVECGEFSWEVLKMKPETGELTKMPNIDLETLNGKVEHLPVKRVHSRPTPIGWLNEEVLALHIYSYHLVCVLYNVRTQEVEVPNIELKSDLCFLKIHRNSLVWLDG